MNNENYAKECGLRCRRIRMAKNWSQQKLADKMYTTPQNISKLEKEGISNIDTIKQLSVIFGEDLLIEERDIEGTVGEIGKEILYLLICSKGKLAIQDLSGNKMYGLSEKDVTNEIFKLERIGLCVREQYTDWYDREADDLFITAKGIVTFKNLANNAEQSRAITDSLVDVKSYEMIIGRWGNIQEYIDNSLAEKMIRNILHDGVDFPVEDISCLYRLNYIKYLKELYVDDEEDFLGCFWVKSHLVHRTKGYYDSIIPSKGIYHDILYRMACRLSNDTVRHILVSAHKYEEKVKKLSNALYNEDIIKEKTRVEFQRAFGRYDDITGHDDLVDKLYSELKPLYEEIMGGPEKYKDWLLNPESDYEEIDAYIEGHSEDISDRFKALIELDKALTLMPEYYNSEAAYAYYRPKASYSTPVDWFSKGEIEEFIKENYHPPKTEWEKSLDLEIRKINELLPSTLEYYTFPKEWEENGLADIVRERCGIEKPKNDAF